MADPKRSPWPVQCVKAILRAWRPTEPEIRAFLIADVRGYTSFTQDRGDEAAVWVVDRGAGEVLRVNPFDGSVLRIYLGAGPGGIAADETSVWVVR